MNTVQYDTLRHFADSWGLIYMFAVFLAVTIFLFRPGAKTHARAAARIPLQKDDDRQ